MSAQLTCEDAIMAVLPDEPPGVVTALHRHARAAWDAVCAESGSSTGTLGRDSALAAARRILPQAFDALARAQKEHFAAMGFDTSSAAVAAAIAEVEALPEADVSGDESDA